MPLRDELLHFVASVGLITRIKLIFTPSFVQEIHLEVRSKAALHNFVDIISKLANLTQL